MSLTPLILSKLDFNFYISIESGVDSMITPIQSLMIYFVVKITIRAKTIVQIGSTIFHSGLIFINIAAMMTPAD